MGVNKIIFPDFFLYSGLGEPERQTIDAEFGEILCFKKGETIYSAESFRHAVGQLLSGRATATADNASDVVMRKFSAGDVFGAAAVFGDSESYVSTIIAASDCKIRFISEEELKEIFRRYPETAVNYISFLSGKIRFLNKKLNVISCASTGGTVFRYLVGNADSEGLVSMPGNMTLLAKMLGISRASLYRSLDTLEADGSIIRENKFIRICKL